MSISFLIFLCCVLAVIGALALLGGPRRDRSGSSAANDAQPADPAATSSSTPAASAWWATLTTPALLVPTTLFALAAWIVVDLSGLQPPGVVSENPFGLVRLSFLGHAYALNALLLLAMAILLAGYVGVLQGLRAGGKPGSLHFWKGIKDHFFTFLLAKVLLALLIKGLSMGLGTGDSIGTVLYLAPSLLLAPLLGTAALHPRSPFKALGAALERSTWDMHGTFKIFIRQVLMLSILWLLFCRLQFGSEYYGDALKSMHLLAQDSSTLSFNSFPILSFLSVGASPATVVCTATAMLISTVFMHHYFRRVMDVPHRPQP